MPVWRAFSSRPRLVSLKLERHAIAAHVRTFVDIVVTAGDDLHAIPFIEVHDGDAIFPAFARRYPEALLRTLHAKVCEWAGKRPAEHLTIDFFAMEPDLEALAGAGADAHLLLPGIAPYAAVIDTIDRYAYASIRAAGRHILDLHPRGALGAPLIAARAHSLVCAHASADLPLLRRWGTSDRGTPAAADFVVALGLAPERVAATLARARSLLAPNGRICVSALGEAGRAALAHAGLAPDALVRAGHAPNVAADEYAAWIGIEPAPPPRPEPPSPARVAAAPVSVLFCARPSGLNVPGGDIVHIDRLSAALARRGHRTLISFDPAPRTEGFDAVVLTDLVVADETLPQFRAVRAFAGPILLMPIFNDHADEAVWGMKAALSAFALAHDDAELAGYLEAVKARTMRFPDSPIEPPPARNEYQPGFEQAQREILAGCDALLAGAYSEVHRIYRYLDCSIPFSVVRAGTDPELFHPRARAAFVAEYGLQDFVLCVGRIEVRKNHLMFAHAARRFPERTFAIVGANYDPLYASTLRMYLPDNLIVLPPMPQARLAGALAAARVVALPSWNEAYSLTALDAAACGAGLVLTRNSYEHEYFGDEAEYCDPGDWQSIAAAIDRAWASSGEDAARRRTRIARDFTWDRAAADCERAVDRLLRSNPRARLRR